MPKKRYYDISNALATKAQYILLLGQRANGKSYQCKQTVLKHAWKTGQKFIYLRRYQKDIKQNYVESYFNDMPIADITEGEFTHVVAWQGFLYFATYDEKLQKMNRECEIGRYCSLNEAIRYKSQVFNDYAYIVYEEFITDETYLVDEPNTLQQFVSTVARHESITVLLVGNTISRVCPYFAEWCLDGVLKQKQGTIEIYHYHTKDGKVDIAVEYCATTNYKNKMFFGQSAKQIITGEWEVNQVPKLPKPIKHYELIYKLKIVYQKNFQFMMLLLNDPDDGGFITFIYPYTGTREIKRIITDKFSSNPFISNSLMPKRFFAESIIQDCFRYGKVCYSDNLTGSDFKQIQANFKLV